MSGNYYWEDRLSSLVKDTESNLDRAKNHLGSIRSDPTVYRPRSPLYSPRHLGRQTGVSSSPRLADYDRSPRLADHDHLARLPGSAGGLDLGISPSLAHIINEKLEKQSAAIDDLCRQVKLMSADHEDDRKRLHGLESELEGVRSRLSEGGVNLRTEHKLNQFRQEVRAEIYDLHSQVKQQRAHHDLSHVPSPSPLDLADRKIFAEELSMLRRDIEALKTKQVKQESERYYHKSKRDRIEEERMKHLEMQELQKQIASLRQDINTLIENRFQTAPKERKRSGSKLKTSGDLLLLSDSDLSSLSLSAAPSRDVSDLSSLDFSDHLPGKDSFHSDDDGDFL